MVDDARIHNKTKSPFFVAYGKSDITYIFVIRIFLPEPFQEHFSQPGGRLQKCNTPEVYKVITYIGKNFNIHIFEIYFK